VENDILKEKFHQLIDQFNDSSILKYFYETMADYQEHKQDILDELTEHQRSRLYESIEQSKKGEVKDWAIVKEEIYQWLEKE